MLHLNKFRDVQYFSLRTQTIAGEQYDKGDEVEDAQDLKKLDMLIRTKRIVAVTGDRNRQPKMFYREIKTIPYVTAKYGFTPTLSNFNNAWLPEHYLVSEVTDFVTANPTQLGRVLVSEVAHRNRTTLVASLRATALTMVSISPTTDVAAGGAACSVTGTSTNIDAALAVVTGVKFGSTSGTSFSYATGTISVTAPAHAAGVVSIVLVAFPGGDLTKTTAFTYTA